MEELANSENPLLSEKNGFDEAAVNHSDGDIKHNQVVNGLSNGYEKEKKEKDKHKDKSQDKVREKEKHRDKDSDRDKHRSKDSDRDKHKDKYKDHKDRDRDKDRHRDKDKEREKDRDKERDKSKHSSSSSSKDKHSSSSKDQDKERKDKDKSRHNDDKDRKDKEHRSSSSNKDKEHKSSSSSKHSSSSSKPSNSSSSKDKERDKGHREKDKERDKEKEKSRDKEKDKERSKEKHSSSSSKDKERHSTDKHRSDKDKSDKDKSDKDKSDKDKSDKDKSDKDKHSSSSRKDKDRHSSDKKDKHKEKDREKEKSRDKEKEKEKEKTIEKEIKMESPEIKVETREIKEEREEEFSLQTSIKDESMDDDDDGKLLIKEEPTDDESKMDYTESSMDMSAVKPEAMEEDDEDDIPMAARMQKMNHMLESEDEDDVPLVSRKKPKKEIVKKRKKVESDYDDEEDFKPAKKKKVKKEKKSAPVKQETVSESPKKKKKKEEEEQEVWKWWEEEKKPDGVKWNFLEHKGPVFAPPYEPLPPNVKFYYDGEEYKLSEPSEEVATFYARMLDHDYTTKEAFNTNFMSDWRKVMTEKEKSTIKDLKKCNFKHMHAYFLKKSEERKAMSKEEKKAIKEANDEITKEYGFCMIDGHKEKIGNFKIEPPGLFRGRGEHPKMGKHKKRVIAEDIIINCSKGSKIPQAPPGHKWKEVRHDNSVTWLASWTENVQGQVKYIMLNPSSKLKGEKDWQKYETARKLAKSIDKIRQDYTADWKSKEMRIRQRAVAMYFIDKLALRAGNEKDEDQADTVGCCSLRVEHIQLHEQKDGKENVVVFDFLGKDSIRYYNEVPVEKRVFKNLTLFMENKKGDDDLFDRLNTAVLNKHLSDLMEGLTAKVFRTYNASWTLQGQLKELTDPDATIAEKLLAYNRANRAVAILCNHQRAVPKTHDKSMANLREKLANKRQAVADAENNFKHAKRDAKNGSAKEKILADKAKKTLERLKEQLLKLELTETDKEENKTIALGTSKLNYLDPRISVAWCKKYDVPIDKIYNKTQRDKFRWAIDMATADYVF